MKNDINGDFEYTFSKNEEYEDETQDEKNQFDYKMFRLENKAIDILQDIKKYNEKFGFSFLKNIKVEDIMNILMNENL